MFKSNGTDEGVLREWLDRESEEWDQAFVDTLDEAVQQLQARCFIELWDELIASGQTEDEVGRKTVELYEHGIADIFRFVRACGVLTDDVAWSTMKTEYRRAASEPQVAVAVREALDAGLYEAEMSPRGSHDDYQVWVRSLMLFLIHHAAQRSEDYPGTTADERSKLSWAYEALKDIEDHDVFHQHVLGYLHDAGVRPVVEGVTGKAVEEIVQFEALLLPLKRFDLVLNTGLVWLAGAVERR